MLGIGLSINTMRSVFGPASLNGLALWLDASKGVTTDGAAHFSAALQQSLSVPHNASLTFADAFTIQGWLWQGASQTQGYPNAVGKNGLAHFESGAWYVWDGNSRISLPSLTYTKDSWHHIALTVEPNGDGSFTARSYLDGAQVGSSLSLLGFPAAQTSPLCFGVRSTASPTTYLDGRLDSWGIHNRALSAAEIANLWNLGSGRVYEELSASLKMGLVSWWNMDELEGVRYDSHGSNHILPNFPVISQYVANGRFDTAGAGGADVFATWGEQANTSLIERDTTNAYNGSASCRIRYDGGSIPYVTSATLTSGQTYGYIVRAKGTGTIRLGSNNANYRNTHALTSAWAEHKGIFYTDSATFIIHPVSIGNEVWIDEVVVFPVNPMIGGSVGNGDFETIQSDNATGFSADADYLSVASNSALQCGGQSYSIEAWVYLTDKSVNRAFISKWNGTPDVEHYLGYTTAADRFIVGVGDGTSTASRTGGTSPALNTWYHLVATFEVTGGATNNLALYVNGVVSTSATACGSHAGSSTPVTIGRLGNSSWYQRGRIQNARFWKGRALTQSDVMALYNGGNPVRYSALTSGQKASLSASWELDGLNAMTTDSHGSNTLTVSGAPAAAMGVNAFASWSEFATAPSAVLYDATTVDSGSASLRLGVVDSAWCAVQQGGLITGHTYHWQARARNSGSGNLQVTDSNEGGSSTTLSSSWATYGGSVKATSSTLTLKRSGGSTNDVWVDNLCVSTLGPQTAVGTASGTAGDGDPIKTWVDMSGKGRNASQSSLAVKPTKGKAGAKNFPVVNFDSFDDSLTTGSFTLAQPNTVFVVAKVSGSRVLMDGLPSGGSHLIQYNPMWGISAGTPLTSAAAADANPHVITAVFNSASSALRLDGTQIASGDAGASNMGGLTIGSAKNGSNVLNGYIAEVIVYNRLLSATEMQRIERYLGGKYGIAVA